eukprot:TRINITY_DN2638_c2_g1_i8.p1 TRINITY_DN2638_c2_g1~~TRINITY_DN2638_c2_g1_i8.p1  ORF type:complete len:551 (-),score=209.50 TRINITY_DN2638_c2_g1_i8:1174-2826(-)
MRELLLLALLVPCIVAPPVDKNQGKGTGEGPKQNETQEDWNLGLEYNKYLQEVVSILESDQEFKKKLENAKVEDIRDGTIAKELEFLSHGIRSKLDEVKRQEVERLRHLAQKQFELNSGIDRKHVKVPQHLELQHKSFEVADLQKLIKQTTKDLEEADKKRKEEFKKYEMEKKFEKEMRLKAINDTQERKTVQEEMEKMEAKHRQHDKMNHPMTKDQLEEVWEEQDHMDAKDFDPKTFFAMHDLDGNGQWDENEVRILFRKELDKVYDPNNPEDDMKEREEEMERMREHVFKESDRDGDRMISYSEFLAETEREEFEKDPGWDSLDDEELYTDEEFQRFEHEREDQIKKLMEAGQLPPGYPYPNIPGMPPVGYGGHPGMGGHPGGMPPPQFGNYAPIPGGPMPGLSANGVPMHGSVPGQPAQPQYVPGNVPMQGNYPQGQQYQQPPQGQQFQQQPQFGAPAPQQMAGQPQQFGAPVGQAGGQPQQFGAPVGGQGGPAGGGQPQQQAFAPVQQAQGQPQKFAPQGGPQQPLKQQQQPQQPAANQPPPRQTP